MAHLKMKTHFCHTHQLIAPRPLSTEKNRFGDNNGANNNIIAAYLRPLVHFGFEQMLCCAALATKTTKQSELIVTGGSICSSDFFYLIFFSILVVHLLSLENTANIRTLAIPEAKNVRMAAPAQW